MKKQTRDTKGRFITGNPGGTGRPKREVERNYLAATLDRITPERWQKVVDRALVDAENGDSRARQWLGDYVLGKPSEILELRGADAIQLANLLDAIRISGMFSPADLFLAIAAELKEPSDLDEQENT